MEKEEVVKTRMLWTSMAWTKAVAKAAKTMCNVGYVSNMATSAKSALRTRTLEEKAEWAQAREMLAEENAGLAVETISLGTAPKEEVKVKAKERKAKEERAKAKEEKVDTKEEKEKKEKEVKAKVKVKGKLLVRSMKIGKMILDGTSRTTQAGNGTRVRGGSRTTPVERSQSLRRGSNHWWET